MGWMDPRYIRTRSWTRASLRELDRPRMWPYWHALPPKGTIGVFLNSWYEGPVADYFVKRAKRLRMRAQIEELNDFEQILSDEGALILKFLFLLPRQQNAQIYRKLRKDPDAAWKVSDYEIEIGKQLAKRSRHAHAVIEEVVSATGTDHAPWIPLASADRRHRDLTIGQTLRDAIVSRLQQPAAAGPNNAAPATLGGTGPNALDSLDLSISLEQDSYSRQLKKEQRGLTKPALGKRFEKRALVAAFEGNDAAGKGGSIRRVVKALDPRTMRVVRIAAPSDEEREHPYLWRFWRHVPRQGYITIFDRSRYGRVLVERVRNTN